MLRDGADADGGLEEELVFERIFDLAGNGKQLFAVALAVDELDHSDVGLIDGDDKVLLPIGEQALQHIHRSHVDVAGLPDKENRAVLIGREMELVGADIDVAGKDIVGDDVFDEGALVMLFFVIDLGAVERHMGHQAKAAGKIIVAVDKNGIVKAVAEVGQRFDGFSGKMYCVVLGEIDDPGKLRPLDAKLLAVAAGHHGALGVDDAELTVGRGLHLFDNIRENMVRHNGPSRK